MITWMGQWPPVRMTMKIHEYLKTKQVVVVMVVVGGGFTLTSIKNSRECENQRTREGCNDATHTLTLVFS